MRNQRLNQIIEFIIENIVDAIANVKLVLEMINSHVSAEDSQKRRKLQVQQDGVKSNSAIIDE